MQQPPPRQRGSGQHSGAFSFEKKLENEEQILDALLATMARGAPPEGVWERLHAAALRDDRLSELAFAFEAASQSKRLKATSPPVGAEFLFQAARFFGEVFGDEVGAVSYLERALALVPGHAASFARLTDVLERTQQTKRLAEVMAAAAQHRPRGEQAPMLRRAAALFAQAGGPEEKVIDLLQQVLRLEASDEDSRARLEALYIKANRFRDVVRLNEQALAADPPPEEHTRRKLLEQIISLYAERLHEPERAMAHVEQLLALDPRHEEARKVAQKLVVIKGLAGRAAAALSSACEVYGTPQEIARYLTIELENTRGPKRSVILMRLGKLRADRMGDEKGAFEAFEQALAIDPSDDELRARYAALADKHKRWTDAAKAFGRVLATVKDAAVKAKASAQLGEMLHRGGDAKRAKTTLAGVLAMPDAPPEAILAAGHALGEILRTEGDTQALSDVLERIATLEPDAEKRQALNEQLAEIASALGDKARAIAAYERLLATPSRGKALEALAPLYEQSGDPEKFARLMEERAKDTADAGKARELMMRAAEVRTRETKDAAGAIAACRAILERFGPARDVLGLLVPLLEAQRQWPELAQALEQDAAFTEGTERAATFSRIGTLRLQRLKDTDAAIAAFQRALSHDPADKTARLTLEKLATLGDHRLEAARVLEPIYRHEGAAGPLLKLLELRGALADEVDDRLGALREASELAARGSETTRAADIVGRGLAEAVAGERPLAEWVERLDGVAGPETEPKRRAAILLKAIGEREVTSPELSALAKKAAEAHAESGDVQTAIALYRRALAFEPHSAELLSCIDDLLRNQGSPTERVALYRAALARGGAVRRKELLHRIGAIERHDLADLSAAIETYRTALEDDPTDGEAYAALTELYSATDRWQDLCALLEARLARVDGEAARSTRATLAEVAASHGDPALARAQCEALLNDPELLPEHLDAVETAADRTGALALARAVLVRRAEMTQDPREQFAWLEKLGALDEERLGDLEAAAAAWKRAATLAESAGDDEGARRVLVRARKVAPEDAEVTARLVAVCERGELWAELPRLYSSLGEQSAEDAVRIELWLKTANVLAERLGDVAMAARRASQAFDMAPTRPDVLATFERLSVASGTLDAFERAIDDAFSRLEGAGGLGPEERGQLLLARARALGASEGRERDAAAAYRAILDDPRLARATQAEALAAFDSLLARGPGSADRRADRRWLLEWRAEHAPEEERVARLLEWAHEEEVAFGEPAQALALHRRVLAADPESDEALVAVARLALETGDTEAALSALRARRDRAAGPARVAVDLEMARVLLARTTRWAEALASLRAVLAETPSDPEARALAAQLLAHRATRSDAIAMLEQACEASDDAEARRQIWLRLLEAPADTDEASARRGWFERLIELEKEQGRVEDALATAARAARELPDVPALWDRAEELARQVTRPDEVAALYEDVLSRALTREQALAIGERAVQFYEEWFEDSTRVVRILERVLELDATADWAFDRLKLLLDAAERWDDLFALYDRALASASGSTRTSLLEDAAQTAKDFADRPDKAIQYLEQLHAVRPGDAKLSSALERLYERRGSHRELVALLTSRLPSLRADEARRVRTRIAGLWLDELGDPGAALDMLEPLVDGSDAAAAPAEVWPLFERILAGTPTPVEVRRSTAPPAAEGAPRSRRRKSEAPTGKASVRQRAAARLREHYEKAGSDGDLARMLRVEIEVVKSIREKVRRHLQVADLYERAGDFDGALEQVGAALVLDPTDAARRVRLSELGDRTGRLERLADLLAAASEDTEPLSLRVSLMMQAAELRADRISDAGGAIDLLSAVLSTHGVASDDVLVAGRRLAPLLEAARKSEQRLDVVERVASLEPDAEASRQALGVAARLATELGQSARAVGLWERRLAADHRDSEALDGLVDLLAGEQAWSRLAEVLELRARAAPNDERRRADRVRVAELLGGQLDKPREAILAWRAIEAEFGESDDAAEALAALLRRTESWSELAELLERRAGRAPDDRGKAEILRTLGDVQREQLEDPGVALETYARAVSADPRNVGARDGLFSLAAHDRWRERASEVLLAAFRSCDDWEAILGMTELRLSAERTAGGKLEVLLEAAATAESRAARPAMAFELVARAFVMAPGDERTQREVARLAEVAGAWAALVAAYREAIDGVANATPDSGRNPEQSLVTRLRALLAAVLDRHLDDPSGALDEYVRVVGSSADVDAGRAVVRIAGELGRWDVAASAVVDVSKARGAASPELLEALEQAAAEAGSWEGPLAALEHAVGAAGLKGAAARDTEARTAEWHRDRRSDPGAAEAALQRALAHDDSNATLLAALVELQRRDRQRPLVDSLLRLSRAWGGDLSLLREAAEVARDSVGDRDLARSIFDELLSMARARWADLSEGETRGDLSSYAEGAVEALALLHEGAQEHREMVTVLVDGSNLPFAASVSRSMRRRAAGIALEQLGDHEHAIALYLQLLDEDAHDEDAASQLATIYAAHHRTRDLLALRERQVVSSLDTTSRIALRLEAAALLVELGEPGRAVDTLRSSLREDARHEATVEALVAVLDRESRAQELRDLLAEQAQLAEDEGQQARAAELWFRAAKMAEERLRDTDGAERLHGRVAALEPRATSFDALARLSTARGDAATAAQWLSRLHDVIEPAGRVEATLRLARALVDAGQAAYAAERLEQAIPTSSEPQPLRHRLAELYREQGEWARLAKLVTDAAADAPDKATRMARLLEGAKLYSDRVGDPQSAIPLLEQAADLAPEDQAVRLSLADALAHAQRFDEARTILQAMIDSFGGRRPKERAPVHYQIARLELVMQNRARALVELDTATRVDPQNPEILRALAELARDDGQLDRAERSYRALLAVLRRRAESDEPISVARSEVLLELSAIAARQGEHDRAKEILESAFEVAAKADFEQERLEASLRARGDNESLVRVLEARLARAGDSPAAARPLSELADVLSDRLNRPEEALAYRLRALAIDPRSVPLHEAALALARSTGKVGSYLDGAAALVDRAADAGDVPLACSLLVRLGAVAETDLRDDARAAAFYERAVALGTRSTEVLRALDRVYERLGDAEKQGALLAMRVEVEAQEGGPRAASDAIYRLAALRLSSAGSIDEGVEMMQTAIELDPQLDRAEQAIRRAVAIDPNHRRLVELFEHVGRQPGHERALVEALALRSRLPGSEPETVREAVEVAMRIGDQALAESLLERFAEGGDAVAIQNESMRAWALSALAGLREAAGDLRRAIELKKTAAQLADPEIARKLEFEVARLAAEGLGDLGLAAETYESLRRRDPADREAWEPLVAVYGRLGDDRRLADLLAGVVDVVDDIGERGRLRLERVRVMMRGLGLGDAEAAPLLREIVDEDPGQVEAAIMLAAILERAGAREELAALLARQIEAAKDRGDTATIASLALRLGALLEATDPMQARNVYYTGLDWDAKSKSLLEALARLLSSSEDASERAELLERRLAVEEGPGAEAMARALAALRSELGDEGGAQRAIELGYRGWPASTELRDRLERTYRDRADWTKLAELCVLDAGARANVDERVARLREAAALWRTELGDPQRAAEALRLAREASPEDPALLRDRVDMLVEAGAHAVAIEELTTALSSAAGDGPGRADLLALRASVRGALADRVGALDDLEAAFAQDRSSYAAPLAEELLRAQHAAEAAGDEAGVREKKLRLSQVLPYAGDVDGARAILADLVKQDPKDRPALRIMANLEEALERWDAASGALRRLVALEEGEAGVEITLRLAAACERAGRPGDARGVLERARSVAPQDRAVRERLEGVYEATGAWHELADLALDDARASGDVADRFAFLARAGRILLEQAGDPSAAVQPLEEARALRSSDPEVVGLLAEAIAQSGRGQDALALLEEVLAPHKGRRARELAPLLWREARVRRALGDGVGEARALAQALEHDPQNGQVCADVGMRAMELEQLDLANRALRAVTLLKSPGPMSKALAYQHMGEIARKQGDPKRAVQLLRRALAEDPSLEGARTLIDAIERGF
jgi:tetratricopeptide (TPR) repeat protein